MENQEGQISPKSRINFWMISTIFLIIIVMFSSVYVFKCTSQSLINISPNQPRTLEKPILPSFYPTKIQVTIIPTPTSTSKAENITQEIITLKIRDWYNRDDKLKASIYKISFDKKNGDTIQIFPATTYGSQIFDSHTTITRKNTTLSIIPEPEGGNPFASIEKPEITLITGIKISDKPIYRLINSSNDQSLQNGYVYTDNYEKLCSSNNRTKACSSGAIEKDGWYVIISCQPDLGSVAECDDIFKSLAITRLVVTERLK